MHLYVCWLTILFLTNLDNEKLKRFKRPMKNTENTETVLSEI